MGISTAKDAQVLVASLRSAYSATPTKLKIIDLYVVYAVLTAVVQVVYMAIVGSFPFNAFLSGVLSCTGQLCLQFVCRCKSTKKTRDSRIFLQKEHLQILFCAIFHFTW